MKDGDDSSEYRESIENLIKINKLQVLFNDWEAFPTQLRSLHVRRPIRRFVVARMIPHVITAEMKSKFRVPESEMKVFEVLAALPDDFTCVWNVGWGVQDAVYQVGEIDFIVSHRDFPLTVLEVKGGKIRFQFGRWERFCEDNKWHPMDSPVTQASQNRKALFSSLQNMSGFNERDDFIPTAAIVVLTDSSSSSLISLPDTNNFVLTVESFVDFRAKLEATMRIPERKLNPDSKGIGAGKASFIYHYFSRLPYLQVPLRSIMELDNEVLHRLSVDHYLTIDQLSDEKRVLISGGAGTGKTVLAVGKALREAAAGKKVLLICYNQLLAEELQARIASHGNAISQNIVVCNFHQLCEKICSKTRRQPVPETSKDSDYWDKLVEETESILLSEEKNSMLFDCIVVDEGQDFKSRWWGILELMWASKLETSIWIFKDDFQDVQNNESYRHNGFFSFRLLRNFRNSKAVFKLISHSRLGRFVAGTISVGPTGASCGIVEIETDDELIRAIGQCMKKLISEDRVSPDHIVILTGSSLDGEEAKSVLKNRKEISGVAITRTANQPQKVLIETIRRYKGLENKYVILVEIDPKHEGQYGLFEKLAYVGASRAITSLTIIAKRTTLERLGLVRHDAEA